MRGSVLAIIPARGGSKGVPRKNIRLLGDRPLIAWTIAAARDSPSVGRVIVSTDDADIAQVARAWGAEVPFMRPAHLSSDTASGEAAFRHAVTEAPGFETAVLLQPTSPFRTTADIEASIGMARQGRSVVSVTEVTKHPAWMFTISEAGMEPVSRAWAEASRRQDLPPVYALNGAIYVVNSRALVAGSKLVGADTMAYVMPRERSIDIDSEADFQKASELLEAGPRT